ncbi:hypothetical protein L3Q82_019561, partial [Scortum barcoo]
PEAVFLTAVMKGNMLIFAPLCLLLCWILPVDSMKVSGINSDLPFILSIKFIFSLPEAKQGIRLSMAEDALDDMYFGCNKTMTIRIKHYFKKENAGTFAAAWKKAQGCAKKRLENKDRGGEALTKDHLQAICVYTSSHPQIYREFNDAILKSKGAYSTSFPFHFLHFWLTSAVQILSNDIRCHTTYRRTNAEFTGNVNQIIRFGLFASSSYIPTLTHFGKKTCFKIETCSGAFLKNYSSVGDYEQEVLIPPYEKFNITQKKKGWDIEGLGDCEVVYILESAGVQSNLNCNAAYK